MKTVLIGSAMTLALALAAGTAHAQEIIAKSDAVVRGASFTLGEVAQLKGFAPAKAAQLAALSLGKSPRVGYPEQVTRKLLEQRAREQAQDVQAVWSGPETVALTRAAATVSGEEIVDRAAFHLYQWLSGEQQRVSIQPIEELPDVPVRQGHVDLRVRAMPYSEALRKRAKVWVDVYVDGSFDRSVPVVFVVEVWRDAWVTSQALSAGDTVRCDQLERREVDVAALPPSSAGALQRLGVCEDAGLKLRRAVAKGQPVLASALAASGEMLAGDAVALRASGHGVQVEVPAVVLSDSRDGQHVRVRRAGMVLDAQSRGAGVVELVTGGV